MVKWHRDAKSFAHGSAERRAANYATSGCSFCWTCGSELDMKFPACKTCKIPHHPIIDQARIQMHTSGILQDKTWSGKPTPSVYHYLNGCRETMESIENRRSKNEITPDQKWEEIKALMQTHIELMDLSCYDPGNVPERLREFLSQGDIEGANAKGVAERGTLHTWAQNMQYNVHVNDQVSWFADHCWFRRFVQTDKYMKHGDRNRERQRQGFTTWWQQYGTWHGKRTFSLILCRRPPTHMSLKRLCPQDSCKCTVRMDMTFKTMLTGNRFRRKRVCVLPMLGAFISQ